MSLTDSLRTFFLTARPWQIATATSFLAAAIAALLSRFLGSESWGESLQFAGIFFILMAVIWTLTERRRRGRQRRGN